MEVAIIAGRPTRPSLTAVGATPTVGRPAITGRGREEDKQRRSGTERGIFQAEVAHHVHQLHLDITGSTCV
jgi:hypothetical protein